MVARPPIAKVIQKNMEKIEFPKGFYKLVKYRDDHWGAVGSVNKSPVELRGATPEEAIKKLTEKLNEQTGKMGSGNKGE